MLAWQILANNKITTTLEENTQLMMPVKTLMPHHLSQWTK